MRVLLHDFSGHPFQAQLARSLAARGHQVCHVECSSYPSGKGDLDGAPGAVTYVSIALDREFSRYSARRRLVDEMSYARRFLRVVADFGPDVVISCNDPLIAKAVFGLGAWRRSQPWVFWLQDIYSVAMSKELERRSRAGRIAGRALQRIERRLLHAADHVVAISADFLPLLREWRVADGHVTVVENWAPLDEVPLEPRDNPWRRSQGLAPDSFVYLYAGTLGLKHNPSRLLDLARDQPDAEVVVVSQGIGADWLRDNGADAHNLRILDYQPWEQLPQVLAAADALVVLLEPDAGVFSVPSKILTNLCAGRPMVASVPASNLGARTIAAANAGIVVDPESADAFVTGARRLRHDADLPTMSSDARAYAEATFDIDAITDRFEAVLHDSLRSPSTRLHRSVPS